ncbi:MAG TPA: hypothetical protein V6C85_15315 [Allocoleopsis sp.]
MHKSEKGEAFADKNPDFTDTSERKCFASTAKNWLLQETTMSVPLTLQNDRRLSCTGLLIRHTRKGMRSRFSR